MNWKQEFDEQFKSCYAYPFTFDEQCNTDIKEFIESLLEEQRKELTDIAWEYVVKSSREEAGSKKELEELLTKHLI